MVLWQVPSVLFLEAKRIEAKFDKGRYGLRTITATPVGHP